MGGLGLFIGFLFSIIFRWFKIYDIRFIYFLFSILPVFLLGLLEDLCKNVSPKYRLFGAITSAIICIYLLDTPLHRVDLPYIDSLLHIKIVSLAFTIFAICGVTNAINIIDGYNGLCAVVSVIMLLAISYVGFKLNDHFIVSITFIVIGAIGGFFIWNYPFGKIFLGDGGAYLIGFTISVLSIYLVNNHAQVSAWFPLLVVIYPVFETLFSIWRKKFKRNISPSYPDKLHLHMLIYRRIVPFVFNISRNNKLMRNSATSPFLWFICSFSVIPAIIFWQNTYILIFFIILFCGFYLWLYKAIVKFKIGKFLKILR